MNPPVPVTPATSPSDGYERLREHALGGPEPEGESLRGLDVLLQEGMAAWMRFTPSSRQGNQRLASGLVLSGCRQGATLVLADMALPQLFASQSKGMLP